MIANMTDINVSSTIAVLGLGAMGAAIARAAAAMGNRVLAWNRTPRSLEEFGLDGAGDIELGQLQGDQRSDN